MSAFKILSFNDANLAESLSINISREQILERDHYRYLKNYLGQTDGIDAKTILIEEKYISKAYLTDYSNYYATCFQRYERECRRVHFFDIEFDEETFKRELLNPDSDFLQKHYLGYIVVKPLPDSVIGPTLLVTYERKQDEENRHFPACRTYKINLFGKELIVRTLAYQEQDTVVSACASVAIWSAFHKTCSLFRTTLPSPSEITKLAGNLFINYGRTYPNQGLDLTQVCRAIDSIGLVSEVRSSSKFNGDIYLASRIIYAYLRAQIPVLLLIKYEEDSKQGHAITVTGYSEPRPRDEKPLEEISLVADRIDKFYIHDDQLGPFASYTFSGQTALKTYVEGENGSKDDISAWIHAAVIPLYPKIRLKYEDVFDTISNIDTLFYELNFFSFELEWDIYLYESNKYKSDLISSNFDESVKSRKLLTNFPRYIWIGRAQVNGQPIFDFLFDATDIPSGHNCIDFVLHDQSLKKFMLPVFEQYSKIFIEDADGPKLGQKAFDLIKQQLQ